MIALRIPMRVRLSTRSIVTRSGAAAGLARGEGEVGGRGGQGRAAERRVALDRGLPQLAGDRAVVDEHVGAVIRAACAATVDPPAPCTVVEEDGISVSEGWSSVVTAAEVARRRRCRPPRSPARRRPARPPPMSRRVGRSG